jgi:hypothetical protein
MSKPRSFSYTGLHSANFYRWFISIAQKAKAEGVNPLEADYNYKDYVAENEFAVRACAQDHPGPPEEPTKKVCENYNWQVDRFKNWLVTASEKQQWCYSCCCVDQRLTLSLGFPWKF